MKKNTVEPIAHNRTSRRAFLKTCALAGIATGTVPKTLFANDPAQRPNIIFILADDLGYQAIGAYGFEQWKVAGSTVPVRTPNVDALTRGGIRFEYAYSSPVCSPTRGQIMTGKYVHRLGLHDILGRRGAVRELDLDAHATVAQGLRAAGYDTVMVGKWHLARPPMGINDEPLRQMHDTDDPHVARAGFTRQFHTVPAHLRQYGDPTREGDHKYYPDVLQDYILNYLDSRKNRKQPFFMYYASPVPHIPHRPTPLNPNGKRGSQSHGDPANLPYVIEYFDRQIGAIVARLDEVGMRENTLIIFAGDNGGAPAGVRPDGSTVGGGKGNVGEGSRVPLTMNWPAFIPPGTVYDGVVDFTDLMPTLLDIAGAPIPGDIDGVSLKGPMSGDSTRVRQWVHCLCLGEYFFRDESYALREDGLLYDVRDETIRNASYPVAMYGVPLSDDKLTEEQRAAKATLEAARAKVLPNGWLPEDLEHFFRKQRNNQTTKSK